MHPIMPGQTPYPHLKTIVFSKSLELPDATDVELQASCDAASIDTIRRRSAGPIYLCGGGAFAGGLLAMGQIDVQRLKRAPIILGEGVQLFGDTTTSPSMEHTETRVHDDDFCFRSIGFCMRSDGKYCPRRFNFKPRK